MKHKRTLSKWTMGRLPPFKYNRPMQTPEIERGGIGPLSLYIFITLLLGYLGLNTAVFLFQVGDPRLAIILLGVCILHIGLYWLNGRAMKSPRWWIFYYSAQALLITAMAFITRGKYEIAISVFESSVICIVGETLGWWGNSRKSLWIGGAYVLLTAVLSLLLNERQTLILAMTGLLINGGGIVLIMILYNQQALEREKAVELAESLESANAKLAASAAKIESLTLQNERQRMARELHDTLAQGVAGLVLQLEAAKAHLASDRNERAAAILEQALSRARGTLAESRAAIDDLRAVPDDLSAAVRERVDRCTQSTGIACELELSLIENQFSKEITGHALGILGEALANITRHARAQKVSVKFLIQNHRLELEVRDDGTGFDVEHSNNGRYGLIGMRERARLSGGRLTVESKPLHGTRILFIIEAEG
jgi:NarL family two-component system sensor histidine kinase YdfH